MVSHARMITIAAAPVVLAAGLAGCSGADASSDSAKNPANDPGVGASAGATHKVAEPKGKHEDYPASTDIGTKELPVDPKTAVAAAREQGAAGDVYAIGADYDHANRTWTYDVQTKTKKQGFRTQIDAVTGKPIESGSNSTATTKPVDPEGQLKYEDALKLATDKVDGRLTSWELQEKGTQPAYQFEIAKDGDGGKLTSVRVDVTSHKVSVSG